MSKNDTDSSAYTPIQCQIYDYIEIACMRHYRLNIELNSSGIIKGQAITTRVRNKQEFIVIKNKDAGEQEIRLDLVKSIQALDDNAEFGKVSIN